MNHTRSDLRSAVEQLSADPSFLRSTSSEEFSKENPSGLEDRAVALTVHRRGAPKRFSNHCLNFPRQRRRGTRIRLRVTSDSPSLLWKFGTFEPAAWFSNALASVSECVWSVQKRSLHRT
jgi:hypothetical protein